MKVSSKTIYGLQFLIRLAISSGKQWVQLKEIVESENVSEKYLESIVSRLKNGGLLQVKRGAQGGYKLADTPDKISLKKIMEVIEGTKLSQDLSNVPAAMNTIVRQVSVDAIKDIDMQFNAVLENLTLEQLSNNASNRLNNFTFMI